MTRLDAIAYGVAAAALIKRWDWISSNRLLLLAIGVALLAAIEMNWLMRMDQFDLTGKFWRTLIFNFSSIAFCLVIPAALQFRACGIAHWLTTKLSALSYGLYLVHAEILLQFVPWTQASHLMRYGLVVSALLLSFVLAYLLFAFVELPVMKLRPKQPL